MGSMPEEDFPRLDLSIRPDVQAALNELQEETLAAQECVKAAEDLLKDAKRFRWLCTHAQSESLSMDGTAYWRIPSYHFSLRARSFYEAIDLAMEQETNGA